MVGAGARVDHWDGTGETTASPWLNAQVRIGAFDLVSGTGVFHQFPGFNAISGLPIPSFPAPLRETILDTAARVIGPGGTFRQLTIMPWVYYKLYRGYFDDVEFRMVPLNLPPGGVYVCRGYKAR